MASSLRLACVGLYVALSILTLARAHDDDDDHMHCQFNGTDGNEYDLAPLKDVEQFYNLHDHFVGWDGVSREHVYYFDICAKATNVLVSECTGVNNTKLPVYACQLAYGRADVYSLGDSQTLSLFNSTTENKPLDAGDHGVLIRTLGGIGSECPNDSERQLDLWLECDPNANTIWRAPKNGIEHLGICEYDILAKSPHACRKCVEEDYNKTVVSPLPEKEGDSSCREDGNYTVRYKKKDGAMCAGGVHGGVNVTHDLNERCDPENCPVGFERKIVHPDFPECQACLPGKSTLGDGKSSCVDCGIGQFSDQHGSRCYPCGAGTEPNADHTECVPLNGMGTCEFVSTTTSLKYNLAPLASVEMYGPVVDPTQSIRSQHRYFLNLCTTANSSNACYGADADEPISYACQIPAGSDAAKDLGDTIGFHDLDSDLRTNYDVQEGGLRVQLKFGSVCHHPGSVPRRETNIILACNATLESGNPLPPPHGQIEPGGNCVYNFLWETKFACPLCQLTGPGATYKQQSDECDPDTGYRKRSYERIHSCIGHPLKAAGNTEPGPEIITNITQEICTPDCPLGTALAQTGPQKCVPCLTGSAGGGHEDKCQACGGNTFTYQEGSPKCLECGANSQAKPDHNDCDLHNCVYTFESGLVFDLHPLDKYNKKTNNMYGPIRDTNTRAGEEEHHQYYINLCSRQTADDLSCSNKEKTPIESFACQRTTVESEFGHLVGTNLGDTMGVEPPVNGTLTITLSNGETCSNFGGDKDMPRETQIEMVCRESTGLGYPVAYHGQAEYETCKYKFEWQSLYACHVCRDSDYTQIVSECVNHTDDNGKILSASQSVHYKKTTPCNHLSDRAYHPPDDESLKCELPTGPIIISDQADTPWYKSPAFLITVIVLSSTIFTVILVFALVKYYKVRRLYETYAQLDKDRGGPDDFSMPEEFEMGGQQKQDGDHEGL